MNNADDSTNQPTELRRLAIESSESVEQMTNDSGESDTELYLKFFARCLIVLGAPSFLWTVYICTFYSVDMQAGLTRLAVTFSMVAVGLILLALLPGGIYSNKKSKKYKSQSEYFFIGGRIDGLMLFLSIPAILGMGILLASGIVAYRNSASGNSEFDSVRVKIESMEIKHVPQDRVGEVRILKEFYLPERYIDLWIACGTVTILELSGSTVEPKACPAIFSYPKIHSTGSKSSYRDYICHHKMDAEMDSESFHVGEIRNAWMRRAAPDAGVLFTRPSDKVLREILILAALLLITCLYLVTRIAIGRKIRDPHWRSLTEIWTK